MRVWVVAISSVLCSCEATYDDHQAYLGADHDARRAILQRALWRPDLPYSRMLLDNYGFGTRGWDLLPPIPEMNHRTGSPRQRSVLRSTSTAIS